MADESAIMVTDQRTGDAFRASHGL